DARIVDAADNDALAHFTTNAASGRFTIQAGVNWVTTGVFINAGVVTVSFASRYNLAGGATITGAGIFQVSGGTLSNTGNASIQNTLINDGTVEVLSGTLSLAGPFNNF